MPLRESEAIILQSYPLGESDRLVSFFSRSMGRVRGVASGARRSKSRFGSTLERMSHVRIWFFERETRDLVRISQCELIESFVGAFQDYSCAMALTLLAEIAENTLPEREPDDPVFRLLLLAAQTIKQRKAADLSLAYFGLWTLRLGGWLGSLDACARCGRELKTSGAFASAHSAGIFCANCRGAGARPISPAALVAARRILSERLDKIGEKEFATSSIAEVERYSLDLIEHHIEKKLRTREMLEPAS